MQRKFRLTKSKDFERVRRLGKSYAHPLVVLIVLPNGSEQSRFGFAASKALGAAVRRNRAKRVMRAAARKLLPDVQVGLDMLLIARRPISEASYHQVLEALQATLSRAEAVRSALFETVPV